VTPCGIVSGAEPILDWHGEVVVKFLGTEGLANAGSRKVGIESEFWVAGFDANCAHRRRAGANMLVMHVLVVLAQISGVASGKVRLSHLDPVIARHRLVATARRTSGRHHHSSLHTSLLLPQNHCMMICSVPN
jgi:hypothetical protein